MFLLLSLYFSSVTSIISCNRKSLTIFNESKISSSQIIAYKDSTSCMIISENEVEIIEDAFNGFSSLRNISIQCPKITIQKSSFSSCSAIKYIMFNSNILNISNGSFLVSTEIIEFQGEKFNSNMISFLTNDTNEFIINITGDCVFSNKNNYFNEHVEQLTVNANNIIFESESIQRTKMKKFIINAINSIFVGIGAICDCQIKEFFLNSGNQIEISPLTFSNFVYETKTITIISNNTINIESGSFVKINTILTNISAKKRILIGQEIFSECSSSTIYINSDESDVLIDSNTFSSSSFNYIKVSA